MSCCRKLVLYIKYIYILYCIFYMRANRILYIMLLYSTCYMYIFIYIYTHTHLYICNIYILYYIYMDGSWCSRSGGQGPSLHVRVHVRARWGAVSWCWWWHKTDVDRHYIKMLYHVMLFRLYCMHVVVACWETYIYTFISSCHMLLVLVFFRYCMVL